MQKVTVPVRPPFIKLDALLKFAGAAATGGQAKELVAAGGVLVNGAPCAQRGRKLRDGDLVVAGEMEITVVFEQ